MEDHLQRAFLDVTKLTCAQTMESIDHTHSQIGDKAMALVDNGEYIKIFTNLKVNAEDKLITAKRSEYSLGNGGEHSVRDNYVNALTAHTLAYNYHKKNLGKLRWGMCKWFVLKPTPMIITIISSLIAGYSVRVLWAASENWPVIKQLIGFLKSF